MNISIDPVVQGAILFHSASLYPLFDSLGFDEAKKIADAAGEASLGYPLLERDRKGNFPSFILPHLGEKSSVFCAAVMASFLVWTQRKAGHPLPDSLLLSAANDGYALYALENKEQEM